MEWNGLGFSFLLFLSCVGFLVLGLGSCVLSYYMWREGGVFFWVGTGFGLVGFVGGGKMVVEIGGLWGEEGRRKEGGYGG